jgi:beta-ureidopropionase / N-carbamoyl-L-amino-acid hydrolase
MKTLHANGERLWSTIARSNEIGIGRAGGLRRLALTDADREMRDQFVAWARVDGREVRVDRVGNVFVRRDGRDPALAPVLVGSHLDTQVAGGRYDGILGVLAGLELLRTLDDAGVDAERSIEVVSWTNEEGARFQPPMMASAAFTNALSVDAVLAAKDATGVTVGDELRRIGYDGDAPVGNPIDSYFELHIEQGPILDRANVDVGIVTSTYTVHGLKVDARGETAHTGPTYMKDRRNALVAAALLAVDVNDIGWRYSDTDGRATVASINAWPNTTGIISEWAQIACDVRHHDRDTADAMLAEVEAAIPRAAQRANVDMEVVGRYRFGDERFDDDLIARLRKAASDLDIATLDIASVAGHDAYNLARVAPTAMIFTPCRDGISHNEREHADLERSLPGVDVLVNAVAERAS